QGNYNGFQVWDIANPAAPTLKVGYLCPASQSDVSVYKNLLFVSGEGMGGRLDCGTQGVHDSVSTDRLRGLRIFDISDIANPKYIANVQTCRGSHTHSVVLDPNDTTHAEAPEDVARSAKAAAEARAKGGFTAAVNGLEYVLGPGFINPMLDSVVRVRHGTGAPTAADSAALRAAIQGIVDVIVGAPKPGTPNTARPGPEQCHDITAYPAIGLAGGACAGYGLLLDIHDVAHPRRLGAVSDSNFSYWHSATFNNDGTKLLFTDEWGGGGGPKCRATD